MWGYVALHTYSLFITSILSINFCTYDGTLYVVQPQIRMKDERFSDNEMRKKKEKKFENF